MSVSKHIKEHIILGVSASNDVFTKLASGQLYIYNAAGASGDTRFGDEINYTVSSSSVANPTVITVAAGTVIPNDVDNLAVTFSGVDGTFAPGINTAYPIDRTGTLTFTVPSNCTVGATTGTANMIIGNGATDHPGASAGAWYSTSPFPQPLWPLIFPKAGGTLDDLIVRFANTNTFGDRISAAFYDLTGNLIASATGTYPLATGGHKQTITVNQSSMPSACLVALQPWVSSTGYPGSAKLSTFQHGQSLFGVSGANLGYSTAPFQSTLDVPSYSADWSSTPWPSVITSVSPYVSSSYVAIDKPPAFYAKWTAP